MASHDAIGKRLRAAYVQCLARNLRDVWIASLGSAAPRYRSALARLAFAANFPPHRFEASIGAQDYMCRICGLGRSEDLDEQEHAARRAKGEFSLFDPVGAMLDLEDLARDRALPVPTADDIALFDRMLATLATARSAKELVAAWKFVPRTNAYSREQLVTTLGACGVLDTPDHPGHLTRWVGFWEYEETPTSGDARPPEAWWRGGVNRAALDQYFRMRGVDRTRFAKKRTEKLALAKQGVRVGRVQLAVGDRIGIRFGDAHVVGVVLGSRAGLPVVEMYRGAWKRWPTEAQLGKAIARLVGQYSSSPLWRREAYALEISHVDWQVLATGQAPPRIAGGSKLPLQQIRTITARNLLYWVQTVCALRA